MTIYASADFKELQVYLIAHHKSFGSPAGCAHASNGIFIYA
jgi:hypothetical protein